MKALSVLLLFALVCLGGCASSKKSATLPDVTIVPRSGWGANEPRPYQQHTPVRITVHHEGTRLEVTQDAARKIKAIQAWGMGPDRNWVDIPYHFLIAPDGTIYEGRAVTTAGETATEYDPSGHLLITCLGNLEVQEVPPAQLQSLIKMIAYTSRKYNIPVETLSTHRDNSTQTTCPGKNLYAFFQNGYILEEVKKELGMK
ncbi:MAG TPA: peptidoglycan recognition family protein [Chitinophagaceae bacterium]